MGIYNKENTNNREQLTKRTSDKALFAAVGRVAQDKEVQADLGVIQKGLDNTASALVVREGAEPYQRVSADYFNILSGAAGKVSPVDASAASPKPVINTVDLAVKFSNEADSRLKDSNTGMTNIHAQHGYRRAPIQKTGSGMAQGKDQVNFLAEFYVNQLIDSVKNGDELSLIVLNVLGNNSREGTALTTAVHQAMVERIINMPNYSPTQRGFLLNNMLGRTVFLNTGAAGKGVTLNQITGWVITPVGKDDGLKALGAKVFNEDPVGVFNLKETPAEGIILNETDSNLKQFNTAVAILHVKKDEKTGTFLARMTSPDGKTVYFENMPIRAAGKVSNGTPSILIGGTEAEMNAEMEKQYMARLGGVIESAGDKVVLNKAALKQALGTGYDNTPILTEWNSTNTGENVSMGADKLVQYLLIKTANQHSPEMLAAMQQALKQCQASMISLRTLLYPANDNERKLSVRVLSQLDGDVRGKVQGFATEKKAQITKALSESHFATTQAGAQSARAGGTVLHQLKNPLDPAAPAFRSAGMLLSMFEPEYMSHMPAEQASFEIIGYVKEFWAALTYLANDNKFHIADMTTPEELDKWLDLTVKVYNAVLQPETEFTKEDLMKENVADVNQFFNDMWAKFEPNIPTLGSPESNMANIFKQYAGPIIDKIDKKSDGPVVRQIDKSATAVGALFTTLAEKFMRPKEERQAENKKVIEEMKARNSNKQ